MLRAEDLALFSRVAAAGGVSEPARALGLRDDDVRARLAELEAELGVRLVEHGPEGLRLTEAGRALATSLDARRAASAGRAPRPRVAGAERLRVSATPLLQVTVLPGIVAAWLAARPAAHAVVGADVPDPDLTFGHAWRADDALQGPLAALRLRLVAAPRWLVRHGQPEGVDDLLEHEILLWPLGASRRWPLVRDGRVEELPVRVRLRSSDVAVVREAAVEGLGPAVLPERVVAGELRGGRLLPLLDGVVAQVGEITIAHREEALSPAAAALVRLALARLGS